MKKYENYIDDSIGYNIGKYLYHTTPTKNIDDIKKNGLRVNGDGRTFFNRTYEPRIYLATSLIAAYDLTINFQSHENYIDDYTIIKLKSEFLKDYDEDEYFVHGIYVDYNISPDYFVDFIDTNELFDKFKDDDLENLY